MKKFVIGIVVVLLSLAAIAFAMHTTTGQVTRGSKTLGTTGAAITGAQVRDKAGGTQIKLQCEYASNCQNPSKFSSASCNPGKLVTGGGCVAASGYIKSAYPFPPPNSKYNCNFEDLYYPNGTIGYGKGCAFAVCCSLT